MLAAIKLVKKRTKVTYNVLINITTNITNLELMDTQFRFSVSRNKGRIHLAWRPFGRNSIIFQFIVSLYPKENKFDKERQVALKMNVATTTIMDNDLIIVKDVTINNTTLKLIDEYIYLGQLIHNSSFLFLETNRKK